MSGTKLMPIWETIKVNTQLGCCPHWVLTNAQLGYLMLNLVTCHQSPCFLHPLNTLSSTSF